MDLNPGCSNAFGLNKHACHLCDKTFESLVELNRHFFDHAILTDDAVAVASRMATPQPQPEPEAEHYPDTQCPVCRKSLYSRYNIKRHLFVVHRMDRNEVLEIINQLRDDPRGSFMCTLCSKYLASRSNLERHLRIVHKLTQDDAKVCSSNNVFLPISNSDFDQIVKGDENDLFKMLTKPGEHSLIQEILMDSFDTPQRFQEAAEEVHSPTYSQRAQPPKIRMNVFIQDIIEKKVVTMFDA